MSSTLPKDGLYYSPEHDTLIQWENFADRQHGMAWAGFLISDRFIGIPMSFESFKTKILDRDYVFIGEVS